MVHHWYYCCDLGKVLPKGDSPSVKGLLVYELV